MMIRERKGNEPGTYKSIGEEMASDGHVALTTGTRMDLRG